MSQDGRNWARIEAEHHTGALFDVGAPGEWDELFIGAPQVRQGWGCCWSAVLADKSRGTMGAIAEGGDSSVPTSTLIPLSQPHQTGAPQLSSLAWGPPPLTHPSRPPPSRLAGGGHGAARPAHVLPLIRQAAPEVCGGGGHLAGRVQVGEAGAHVPGQRPLPACLAGELVGLVLSCFYGALLLPSFCFRSCCHSRWRLCL